MSNSLQLDVRDLAVARGGRVLVSGLAFSLAQGQGLIVRGPNGAGKSTLLRALAGLLPVEAGSIALSGADEGETLASSAHYLGHRNAMKDALTAAENLSFWQDFCGAAHLSVPEALAAVGLPHVAETPFGWLSTGQKRRVAIARLLVSSRAVWILDEPTAGLDAASSQALDAMLRDHLAGGGILIAATHLPLDVPGVTFLDIAGDSE